MRSSKGRSWRFLAKFRDPICEHRCGNFDVSAQLVSGMAAQKEAVEKGRFSLRELKVLHRFIGLWARRYCRVG